MKSLLLLYFILCTTNEILGWYTCDDKPFCKELRYKENGLSPFQINLESLTATNEEAVVNLINTENNKTFHLTVSCVDNSIFRFKVEDPEKRRFTPKEALIDFNLSFMETSVYGDYIRIDCDRSSAILTSLSTIVLLQDDTEIAVFNNRRRLYVNSEDDNEAISLDFEILGTDRAYGLPLHAERLSLRNTEPGGNNPYRLYNVDHCCYAVDSQEPLYGSVPVVYAHGRRRSTGVFWLNSAQTFVDVSNNGNTVLIFISESGIMDFFILPGPTLQEATRQYTKLTGTANLPPYFSLGYHQSRYSYMSQTDLLNVVENFDEHNFPLDVIWLDIDYTDSYKYFTWNYDAFPNPIQMQETLNSTGRNLVVIIDPHIKVEEGYFVYDIGKENGFFVHNPDGSIFEGQCWPGLSTYIDFSNPSALKWYSSLYHLENFPSSMENMFLWNDMNEPVVFDQDEETMPNHLVHFDNWTHRDLHNMYGFLQTLGTWNGLMERSENQQRPFILTRSHFAGTQRYAAIWTGDNLPTWEHLKVSIPMCLTEALAGISNCGADIGGFVGNVETELLERWYQTGAWLPFFRQHSTNNVDRREPYLYPEEVQTTFRTAMRDRYSHLPYWYTTWYEHERYGDPVIRPISFHYFDDISTYDIDNQWLVGENILVHPVTDPQTTFAMVYFPGGDQTYWYDVNNNVMYLGVGYIEVDAPINVTPYFYKSGSVIIRKNTPRPSSLQTKDDPYNVYVLLNAANEATGTLYIDDHISLDYRNNKYAYYQFSYINDELIIYVVDTESDFIHDSTIGSVTVYKPPSVLPNGANQIMLGEENILIKKDLNVKLSRKLSIKLS